MLALTIANLKMMARNRQTTFWALFFPLIFVVVFGLFDFTSGAASSVAVIDSSNNPASQELANSLKEIEILNFQEPPSGMVEGQTLVQDGDLDFLIEIPAGFGPDPDGVASFSSGAAADLSGQVEPVTLVLGTGDEERNQLVSGIVRQLTDAVVLGESGGSPPATLVTQRVNTRDVPYFDLVLLGLVGMGIMAHSIISIAVRISNYRNLSILKRMLVTPLSIWKFFAAEVTAQLVLALIQATVILAVGTLVFDARLTGNVLYMVPVIILGSLVFLNIGFIISAWANSPAAASGMGNVVTFPMMFFAGTFFSTSALPWLLPYAADALPLAPMITALRDIGLQGATIVDVWPELAWLGGWVAATSLMAVRVFRFS